MVLLIALMPVDDTQERLIVGEPADVVDHKASDLVAYPICKPRDMGGYDRVGQVPEWAVIRQRL